MILLRYFVARAWAALLFATLWHVARPAMARRLAPDQTIYVTTDVPPRRAVKNMTMECIGRGPLGVQTVLLSQDPDPTATPSRLADAYLWLVNRELRAKCAARWHGERLHTHLTR